MSEHYPFHETIRKMAGKGWGRTHENEDEAKRCLDIPGAAALEIVRRLNQVIDAWSNDATKHEAYGKNIERPTNIGKFPGIKVGDRLYVCEDIEYGIREYLVVTVVDEQHALVAQCHIPENDDYFREIEWACDWHYLSEAEALMQQCETDVKWHKPRYEKAKEILKAINDGKDVSEYRDGIDFDSLEESG